ncbi:MAG: hypothetical protein ABW115_04895 [Candidatus Thiodiazotropha sp. 6PLUC6]
MNSLKASLEALFQQLLAEYGPQHWWPADSDFEVMVGAVLTQNTAWNNVEKAIQNLKSTCELNCDEGFFNEFHALIVIHAKSICQTRPKCDVCTLGSICDYGANSD